MHPAHRLCVDASGRWYSLSLRAAINAVLTGLATAIMGLVVARNWRGNDWLLLVFYAALTVYNINMAIGALRKMKHFSAAAKNIAAASTLLSCIGREHHLDQAQAAIDRACND